MTSPTFIVFEDCSPQPQEAIPMEKRHAYATSSHALVDDADKENVDPLMGQHPAPTTDKKRKNPLLSTKSHAALRTKGQTDTLEIKPVSKMRKPYKKTGKPSGKGRMASEKPSHRVSPLPQVEERVSEREIRRIKQVDIKSRCYQLTVKPLADLSEAFRCPQAFIGDDRATGEILADKDYVVDLKPCDYSMLVPPTPPPTPVNTLPRHTTSFSTLERKLLFAAFTFSSPSPSKRFKKVKSIGNGSACTSPTP